MNITPFDKNYSRFIFAGTPWQKIFEGILSGELPKKSMGVSIDEDEISLEWLKTLPGLVKPPKFKVKHLRELVMPYVKKYDPFYPQYNGVRVVNGFSYWIDGHILFKIKDGITENIIHPDALDSRTPDYECVIPKYKSKPEYPDLMDWYIKAHAMNELTKTLNNRNYPIRLRYKGIGLTPEVIIKALKIALSLHSNWSLKTDGSNRALMFESENDLMLVFPCLLDGCEYIIDL